MDERKLKSEVFFKAVRSSGPGGQNVNKVSSAAELHWDFLNSLVVSDWQKSMIQKKLESMINVEGILKIRSDRFRDLGQNKRDCLQKLNSALEKCFRSVKPRIATKPKYSAKIKAQDQKRHLSAKKASRRKVQLSD
jgi:ribosome-associated protein